MGKEKYKVSISIFRIDESLNYTSLRNTIVSHEIVMFKNSAESWALPLSTTIFALKRVKLISCSSVCNQNCMLRLLYEIVLREGSSSQNLQREFALKKCIVRVIADFKQQDNCRDALSQT